MKVRILILGLLFLSAAAFAGDLLFMVPNGQKTTSADYVVPMLDGATTGFKDVASFTVSVPASIAVQCPTLPAGSKFVRFYIRSGTSGVNIGGASIASGTTYPSVASDTCSDWIPVATTTPSIYLIGTTAVATASALAR